jgi:RNA polymerase sigma-70 factor (ECF subfamily)
MTLDSRWVCDGSCKAMDESTRQAMDIFFRDSEQKAFLMARALTRSHQDALELVQESMLKLVQNYASRAPEEWGPLFYRILQNGIRDWYRKQKFRQLFQGLMPWNADDVETAGVAASAENKVELDEDLQHVVDALNQLPLRQQQTFLMRAWQEFSTRETAYALSISENSVKTHYARAIRQLRVILEDDYG